MVVGGEASAGSSEVKVWGSEVGDVYVAVKEGMLGGVVFLIWSDGVVKVGLDM